MPLLLSVTLFANSPGSLLLIILFPTGVLFLLPPRESGTPLPSSLGHSRPTSPTPDRASDNHNNDSGTASIPSTVPPLAALTTYRGHMLLLTCLCILAVDFPVFPRSLAKCETYGVSLVSSSERLIRSRLTAAFTTDGPRCWLIRILAGCRICYSADQGS